MLESIEVKHYKGFNNAIIDIKPITLFLGENSSGKTSILQLLMMLKQTAQPTIFNNKSPLTLNGYFTKMGPALHLFHAKDTSQPIEISITFTKKLDYKFNELLRNYIDAIYRISSSFNLKGIYSVFNDNKGMRSLFSDDIIDIKSFSEFMKDVVDTISKPAAQEYLKKSNFITSRNTFLSTWDFYEPNLRNFTSVFEMLSNLKEEIKDKKYYTVTYSLSYDKSRKRIIISEIKIKSQYTSDKNLTEEGNENNNYLFFFSRINPSNVIFKSNLLDMSEMDSHHISAIDNSFRLSRPIFECFDYPYNKIKGSQQETTLSNSFLRIAEIVLDALKEEFSLGGVNHIGPLRAAPKQYYVLDKEYFSAFFDLSVGETCVEILKNDPYAKMFVNKWLDKFGFNVDVRDSEEDMINHIEIDQNNLKLNIPEVGFGISQILPILLQCSVAFPNSTTLIEQPEIHLHPKMQAALANLFADAIHSNKKLIIESHSEYMLRRLRRMMAEYKVRKDKNGLVSPDNVAIYYFEKKAKDNVSVKRLDISNTGAFEWPKSFYETELEDNLCFLEAQY